MAPRAWWLACLAALAAACSERRQPPPEPPAVHVEQRPGRISEAPVVAPLPSLERRARREPPLRPAFEPDAAFARAGSVPARRLVYRVQLKLTRSLRAAAGHGADAPTAELRVDLSAHRLRVRFDGKLWPVGDGAEVRLRDDAPGAYVFGVDGGRPLGAGKLAAWFAGGRVRHAPRVRWRLPPPSERGGLGAMLCRLLVEWGRLEPSEGIRRCHLGGTLPRFRVGPWAAERTADVAVRTSRRALRADEGDPPRGLLPTAGVRLVRSLEYLRALPPGRPAPPGSRWAAAEGVLRVANRTGRRVLLLLEGRPAAWLDAGASWRLEGLRPGVYRVAAIRPFGAVVLSPRGLRIPGEVVLGPRWRERQAGGGVDGGGPVLAR